jgi:hypothetical protein
LKKATDRLQDSWTFQNKKLTSELLSVVVTKPRGRKPCNFTLGSPVGTSNCVAIELGCKFPFDRGALLLKVSQFRENAA